MNRDPLIGRRIRDYEILERLGEGGMGSVYRGRHVFLDEERAIKLIQSRLAGDKMFLERFLREARILVKLRHPNLVQLFEFGSLEEDTFFMVLELLRGESVMDRLIRLRKIALSDSVRIIREVAQGLACAHRKGIIHRDLSPDNIFLVKDEFGEETAKLIDFGIAKPAIDRGEVQTLFGVFLGKPEYASPEQCRALPTTDLDHRTDIYSLGVTFYQMVCGRLPIRARTPREYLQKQVTEIPPPLSSHFQPGTLPESLDRLLLKMLAKKREDRHATIDDVLAELDEVGGEITTRTGAFRKPVTAHPQPGNTFAGRYQIQERLTKGSTGVVYKTFDTWLKTPVTVKFLDTVQFNEKTLERMKREVLLARRVVHPNVCRIYDLSQSEGIYFVTMEYIEGTTLEEKLQQYKRLSPNEGLTVIRKVLRGLNEAHEIGVVHRDLKPENIMLRSGGDGVAIMDFGISISPDAVRVTGANTLIGTPHYMAPEQFQGETVDARADLYSVAVIMYRMFTGELPFTAESPLDVGILHIKEKPKSPRDLNPMLSSDLENIILKALRKNPEERFHTAREMLKELEMQDNMTRNITRREALATNLLAEKHYTQAIDLLGILVKQNPGSDKWKELLHNAQMGKARKSLRRMRILLKKQNLIQAQLLADSIRHKYAEFPAVIRRLERLEKALSKKSRTTMISYINEIEALIDKREAVSALSCLEAARHVKPDDPRIQEVSRKVSILMREKLNASPQMKLYQARDLWQAGHSDKATLLLRELLRENPSFGGAHALLRKIENETSLVQIDSRLPQALDSLASGDFVGTEKLIDSLVREIPDSHRLTDLRLLLEFVRGLERLRQKPDFVELVSAAKVLMERQMFGDKFQEPLAKLVKTCEAMAVNEQQVIGMIAKGEALYSKDKWVEALEVFQQALQLKPADSRIMEWIERVKSRFMEKTRPLHALPAFMVEVETILRMLQDGKSPQLHTALDQLHKRAKGSKFEKPVSEMTGTILAIENCFITYDLSKVEEYVDRLSANSLCSSHGDALARLREDVHKREKEALQFIRLFQIGIRHYHSSNWELAMEYFRQAKDIYAGFEELQRYLAATEEKLKK